METSIISQKIEGFGKRPPVDGRPGLPGPLKSGTASSSPTPLPFFPFATLPVEVGHQQNQLDSLGSSPSWVCAASQPKSNLVHYRRLNYDIWFTIFMISRESTHQISCSSLLIKVNIILLNRGMSITSAL